MEAMEKIGSREYREYKEVEIVENRMSIIDDNDYNTMNPEYEGIGNIDELFD